MKKFYDEASYVPSAQGYAMLLDGKPVHTPAKRALSAPNEAVAAAIAQEWNVQGDEIDKSTLPMTSFASLAIDIAAPKREELLEELLEYGETDLLFYRDDQEPALEAIQQAQWQPWVEWAQARFGTQYVLAGGVMPVEQPAGNCAAHRHALEPLSSWQLAALAAVVKPTTSLLLGMAFMEDALDDGELFALCRVEERFNSDKWGEDEEARQAAEHVACELRLVANWLALL